MPCLAAHNPHVRIGWACAGMCREVNIALCTVVNWWRIQVYFDKVSSPESSAQVGTNQQMFGCLVNLWVKPCVQVFHIFDGYIDWTPHHHLKSWNIRFCQYHFSPHICVQYLLLHLLNSFRNVHLLILLVTALSILQWFWDL